MNQLPLSDDVQFWSRQMSEHALFLALLLQDQPLRDQAMALHQNWEQTIASGGDVRMALSQLITFKERVLARLQRGEWLGWCLPSFLSHIIMEAKYFASRLNQGTSTAQDVATFLQIGLDHAAIAPKLIDPMGTEFATAFDQARARILNLQRYCSSHIDQNCLGNMKIELEADAAAVAGLPQNVSIVHPVLQAHIIRENQRGANVAGLLGGR